MAPNTPYTEVSVSRVISCLRNLRHMEPRVVLMIGTNDLRLVCTTDAILPLS